MRLVAIVLTAYTVMFYLAVAVNGGLPIGDYGFHLEIIKDYVANGVAPLSSTVARNGNGFPYPPYSHVLFAVASIITGIGVEGILAFVQVFVFPLVLISFFLFVLSHSGGRSMDKASSAVLLGLSGFALWDRPSQIIPHAVDSMLIPVMMGAYLGGRHRLFILSALSLVYNHAFYVLPLVGVLGVESLFNRRHLWRFAWIGVGVLPLFYLLAPFWRRILLFPDLNEASSPQYVLFMANHWWGVTYIGPLVFILGIWAYSKISQERNINYTPYEWALVAWVVGFLPLLSQFPHRALTYLAMPLAALAAERYHTEDWRTFFFGVWTLYFIVELAMLYAGWRVAPVDGLFNLLIGWTETPVAKPF